MTHKDKALKRALEALEAHADIGIKSDKAITAIKQALAAQPAVQEPYSAPVKELWSVAPKPVADFDDQRVQTVYNILCDADEGKPRDEHWEGWKARRIVAALNTPPAAQPAPVQEHVATLIEHYAFTDGIVRFDGVENMEQLPVGTKFYTTPLAQPPVQEPFCFYYVENGEEYFAPKGAYVPDNAQPLYTTPPAPAVPDALNPKDENPAYASGWNDCRAEMLKGMKP
jgi:hypothetical protein